MDWPRYLRAIEAESIGDTEEKNRAQQAGVLESKQISTEEWADIRDNTELLEEYYPDGD
jgi:hypothetical protein